MEIKNPLAVTLASAVALNCVGVGYGVQLFTDLPPMAAVAFASASSFSGTMNVPFYSTTTDELIEVPVIEKDKTEQS